MNKEIYEVRLKCSNNDIISAIDDFFDQWDPNTETLMGKESELQQALCWKI